MFEWIVTSSAVILIVILLRTLLKGRVSLRLQYGLWAIVLVRLLVPFTFGQSPISVLSAVENLPRVETMEVTTNSETVLPQFHAETEGEPAPSVSLSPEETVLSAPSIQPAEPTPENAASSSLPSFSGLSTQGTDILYSIWYGGMVVMAALLLGSNLHFSRMLRKTRTYFEGCSSPLPVYLSDWVETPCVFGVFRPTMYLTPDSLQSPERQTHILSHEETHYRHKDHIWALLRCVCLVLHWYNPLVWLAASLSRRDCELACDESTLIRLGEAQRGSYGRTLIEMTCQGRSGLLTTATTMSGSKASLRERVNLIARGVRMKGITAAAVVLICAITVSCGFSGGASKEDQQKVETIEGFLTAYYTVPNSKWVEAEREFWDIIAETGAAPNDEDHPINEALQEMFGEYVPEDSLMYWYQRALSLHSQSFDEQNDFDTLYTVSPKKITVTPWENSSGDEWEAEVVLNYQPTGGTSTELTVNILLSLTEDGLIATKNDYSGDHTSLQSLIYDTLNIGPFSGFNPAEVFKILLDHPNETLMPAYAAHSAGTATESDLLEALKTALGEQKCTEEFCLSYLNGEGFGAFRQACMEYDLTAEINPSSNDLMITYLSSLEQDFYAKVLVTNSYGKKKLVNITGFITSSEDGILESIEVTGGLDAFLSSVAEFAEEGKPVDRE